MPDDIGKEYLAILGKFMEAFGRIRQKPRDQKNVNFVS
jgi:hypothetical protein